MKPRWQSADAPPTYTTDAFQFKSEILQNKMDKIDKTLTRFLFKIVSEKF